MKKIIALAVATAISAPAMADLTIGGSARYQMSDSDAASTVNTNRVLVSVSGSSTAESGVFVSAGATLQLAGADTSTDGDNAVTIGNGDANVVLGYAQAGGVYGKGTDAFRQGTSPQDRANGRESNNYTVNVTAVENLTASYSGNFENSGSDIRLGYDFGAFAVSAGITDAGDSGAEDSTVLKATTTIADVALSVSRADQDSGEWTNVNASYMGFNVAFEDQNGTDAVYGHYSIAAPAGLEGLTVTVGHGAVDGGDSVTGVRLDYAF